MRHRPLCTGRTGTSSAAWDTRMWPCGRRLVLAQRRPWDSRMASRTDLLPVALQARAAMSRPAERGTRGEHGAAAGGRRAIAPRGAIAQHALTRSASLSRTHRGPGRRACRPGLRRQARRLRAGCPWRSGLACRLGASERLGVANGTALTPFYYTTRLVARSNAIPEGGCGRAALQAWQRGACRGELRWWMLLITTTRQRSTSSTFQTTSPSSQTRAMACFQRVRAPRLPRSSRTQISSSVRCAPSWQVVEPRRRRCQHPAVWRRQQSAPSQRSGLGRRGFARTLHHHSRLGQGFQASPGASASGQ